MRIGGISFWTACFFASASLVFGGSYLSGTATQTFDKPDGTIDLADGSIIGSDQKAPDGTPVAGVFGAALRLADKNTTNAIGSFKLPDLDPGNVIRTFDVRFNVVLDLVAGASSPGEGWSINFGKIPEDNGTGEGGFAPLPGGLTIAFDTFDTAEDPSSIEIFVGGVSIGNFPRAFSAGTVARTVVIHWDAAGLDLTFDNRAVCVDLPMPGFSPGPGDLFAFSARTTAATMDLFIDSLRITTQALPVIETGGPVISEFVANNREFEDEFADKPGWIELLNGGPTTADLTGWYLTDSKENLKKWRIDGLRLTPYNYQVVFASGRDRQISGTSFPHANFQLAKEGGYVALVRPDGSVASGFEYGPQDANVSYGEKGTDRKRGYMFPASPGAVNTSDPAPNSFSPDVEFWHPGGFISEPVELNLSVFKAPGAEIRYTLDRTEPGPNSLLFTNPITITQIVMVKARAYLPDHLPGRVNSRAFVMIDGTLTNYADTGKIFDSNLPLIYVDTFGVNVDGSTGGARPFRPSYAVVIAPDANTGRASLNTPPQYAGPAGLHVRGESSAGFEQRSYALELWDEYGKDRDASLLGMPADSDWVLFGPWSEKALMRNKLVFDWMIALRGEDGTAPRSRFVELFCNQTRAASGKVGYASYRGIYVLMEKLKRGKGRVPLENLNDKTTDPELITGGYIIRKDKDDALKSNWTTSRMGIPLQSFDPDRFNSNQLSYMRNYMSAFETALNAPGFRNFTNGYQAYIDPDTFIDFQWMTEIAKQVDGYVFSVYFHKNRAGRLRGGPLWDFNISLGNADYGSGDRNTGWLYDVANGVGQLWFPRLHADPDYRLAHWDRYWQMRRTFLATDAVMAKIDEHMRTLLDGYAGLVSNRAPASIQNPVARHFRRWPRLGTRDWPNPPQETSIRTWQAEVDYMKNWIRPRLAWLDDQSLRTGRVALRPPVLSHEGGVITEPVELSIEPYRRVDATTTFPEGDIYYTLDNSDPRLPGGEISPSALKYSSPITISSALTVKARLYYQKSWSPLAPATFLAGAVPAHATNLVVSELLFRPAPLTAAETNALILDPRGFEFMELRNISARPVDLAGVKVTRGVEFDFAYTQPSARLLKPGESVVLVADKRAFQMRHPHVPLHKIAGQFSGHLDGGGETLEILGADGSVIKQFRYDDDAPWPSAGAEGGRSIVLKNSAANPDPALPASWTVSAKIGGTPGRSGTGSDTFNGDPLRDSDGDGLADLFEFAAGTDPEDPGSNSWPSAAVVEMDAGGARANYLTLRFNRHPEARGVKLSLEATRDLIQWVPADAELASIGSVTNRDGTVTESYRGAAPVSDARAVFYRLKVERE